MICDGTIKPVPVPVKPESEGPEVKETTKLPEVPSEGAATTPADGAMAIQPVDGPAQPAEPEIMPAEAPAPSTPRKVCCVLPLLVFEDLHRCCAYNGNYYPASVAFSVVQINCRSCTALHVYWTGTRRWQRSDTCT